MKVKCIKARTMSRFLTEGKIYEVLNGIEPGIFPDRPYVAIIDNLGKKTRWHLKRFEIVED